MPGRGRQQLAHVLAWMHLRAERGELTVELMARDLGVRERTVVRWRQEVGLSGLKDARRSNRQAAIRHMVRIDPHVTDKTMAARMGVAREYVGDLRRRLGIADAQQRLRDEVQFYLNADFGMPVACIRDGLEADGWVLHFDLYGVVRAVRRKMRQASS